MQKIEITVTKLNRVLLSILLLVIFIVSFFGYFLQFKEVLLKLIIPLLVFILIVGFSYALSFGSLILHVSEGNIDFKWKKRFLFDKNNIKSVSILEIKTLVIESPYLLKKIITKDREISINNLKTSNKRFHSFFKTLISELKENNTRVIHSDVYYKEKGYYDNSFIITVILLSASIFFISRLWEYIDYYSIVLLVFPFLTFLHHLRKQKKKRNKN